MVEGPIHVRDMLGSLLVYVWIVTCGNAAASYSALLHLLADANDYCREVCTSGCLIARNFSS